MANGQSVSVVIPTMRGEGTIRESVESALTQTHSHLEVIVVLDGAGPAIRDALRPITDPRLRVIEIAGPSGGPAAPRNAGVRASSGTWVALLDDDDVWVADKLEAQLAVATAKDAGLVYSRATVDEGGSLSDFHTRWAPHLRCLPEGDVLRASVRTVAVPTSSVLVERRLLQQAGGFRTNLGPFDDYDMWLRLALQGARFGAVNRSLYRYRFDAEGASGRNSHLERVETRVRLWRQLLEDFPDRESILQEALGQEEQALAELLLRSAFRMEGAPSQRWSAFKEGMRLAPTLRSARVLGSLLKMEVSTSTGKGYRLGRVAAGDE